jgi:hypothetical protein
MKGTRLVVLVCGTAMTCCSDRVSFEGDGTLTDHGVLSNNPRYQIRLQPAISLAAAGRHEFKFKGAPEVPLSLMLEIQGGGKYEVLSALRTSVRVAVLEADGEVICVAEGPLTKWKLKWPVLGEGGAYWTGAYWKRSCLDRTFGTTQWYTVLCEVSDAESTPAVVVTPLLEGGGWEPL